MPGVCEINKNMFSLSSDRILNNYSKTIRVILHLISGKLQVLPSRLVHQTLCYGRHIVYLKKKKIGRYF